MRKTRRAVYDQELIVFALRLDVDCSHDRYIKQVGKLVRLARKDCSQSHGKVTE